MKRKINKIILYALAGQAVAFMLSWQAVAMAQQKLPEITQEVQSDMNEPAKEQQEKPAQRTGRMSWSEATQDSPVFSSQTQQNDPRTSALHGSPETGYAGTWTDPATGDIITSVIAPTPSPGSQTYNSMPIIVEPNTSGWNNTSGNSPNYTPWPVAPGSPGYPGSNSGYGGYGHKPYHPYRPYNQGMVPGRVPYPKPPYGQFNPSYRPLLPQPLLPPPPPQSTNPGGIYNPNTPVWPTGQSPKPQLPEYNIPGWKPFPPESNRYGPIWVPGSSTPHYPQYNIPGWRPFPPESNRYGPMLPPPSSQYGVSGIPPSWRR